MALFAAVLLVTAAKLAIIFTGPDYDGDAYAHAMAGRRMLLTPGDVTLHWVWLPLIHVLYAAATLAGDGLRAMRVFNALVSSASALLFAWFLRDRARRAPATSAESSLAPSFVPWLAGALLAADPLDIWLGVTGQTEPLFQLLILGLCVAYERRAFVTGGLLLAAAALTRYEAWPLLAVGVWIAARDRPLRARAQALWLLPAIAVAGWCLFHYRATGEPLQFLRYNRDFVEGYLRGVGYPWGREPSLPLMAIFYITAVPVWNMLGPIHLLGFVGLPRAARELPRVFFVVSAALLVIVIAGFLRGTHLGLPRHAVAFSPLFCVLVAVGTEALATRAAERFPRFSDEKLRPFFAFAVLGLVLLTRTLPRTLVLWSVTRTIYAEQAAAAEALQKVAAPGEPIFCDDGKIEVLSALAPDRFHRWQIPDVAPEHIATLARRAGSALVVSTPARAAHLPGGHALWMGGPLTIYRYPAVD